MKAVNENKAFAFLITSCTNVGFVKRFSCLISRNSTFVTLTEIISGLQMDHTSKSY